MNFESIKKSLKELISNKTNDELNSELVYMTAVADYIIKMHSECRQCYNFSKRKKKRMLFSETFNKVLISSLAACINKDYKQVYMYLKEIENKHYNPNKENCRKACELISNLRSVFEDILLEQNFYNLDNGSYI